MIEITSPRSVYSYTVNYQRWMPDLEVPYAIVLVEFPEHPGFHVVGRLRGCAPEDAAIDMEVDVGFEPGPRGYADPELRRGPRATTEMSEHFEHRVVISGVGQSAVGRQLDRSGFQLTLDAILAAVDDAGLTVDDINGSRCSRVAGSRICRATRPRASTRSGRVAHVADLAARASRA